MRAEFRAVELDRALLRLFQFEPVRVVVDLEVRPALPRVFDLRVEPVRLVVRFEVRLVVPLVDRLELRVLDPVLDVRVDLFAFHASWKQLISMSSTFGPEVGFHQQHGTRFFTAKFFTVALLLHPEYPLRTICIGSTIVIFFVAIVSIPLSALDLVESNGGFCGIKKVFGTRSIGL